MTQGLRRPVSINKEKSQQYFCRVIDAPIPFSQAIFKTGSGVRTNWVMLMLKAQLSS